MKEIIQKHLMEIEQKENVKILFAIESGSRAWGFASPDSDYDVRFIYVRPVAEYLKLEKRRDVIEYMLTDELDINGWDIDKALKLLRTSNPTFFEWSNSPIVYKQTDFFKKLNRIKNKYFYCKTGLYHYLNMATGNYREYLKKDEVKLKKYFYVL
ncbi:MAG: nucleotidyltransferase domain-containing protein, partial [Betaproteobacteria bacterium]|nr:nucleotidyltransferase domain-containing protein [Betaproteobacteria bacterium]